MSQSSSLKQTLESLRDQPDQLIEIILRQAAAMEELAQKIQQLEEKIRELNSQLTTKDEELKKKEVQYSKLIINFYLGICMY